MIIGAPSTYSKEFENHVLRFERYFKLPLELRVLRDKLKKEAMNDAKKLKEMRDEEVLNPWVITDLDYALDGNPYISELNNLESIVLIKSQLTVNNLRIDQRK